MMCFDVCQEKIFFYGNVFVFYINIILKVDYIELDWVKSEVLVRGVFNDIIGVIEGKFEFIEGENIFVVN